MKHAQCQTDGEVKAEGLMIGVETSGQNDSWEQERVGKEGAEEHKLNEEE